MKYLIAILVLFSLGNGGYYAQSTLIIHVEICRDTSFESLLCPTISVYKDDQKLKTVQIVPFTPKDTLTQLDPGNYRLDYKTIFDKPESVFITIAENKEYHIVLCDDYLDHEAEKDISFINQLQDGEHFSIHVESTSCESREEWALVVTREGDEYYLFSENGTKTLSKADIRTIRNFEIELQYMQNSGCTIEQVYTLTYKDKKVFIRDGSCNWVGIYYLLKGLNLWKDE